MNLHHPIALLLMLALAGLFHLRLILRALNLARLALPIPDALRQVFPAERDEDRRAYLAANAALNTWRDALGLGAVIGFWALDGWAWLQQRCADWAGTQSLGGLGDDLLAIGLVGGVLAFCQLPLDAWQTFRIEQQAGFNRCSLGTFLGDHLKAALLSALLGLPILAALLCAISHGFMGWALLWLGFGGFLWLMQHLAPRLFLPLFLQTKALTGPLAERIHQAMIEWELPAQSVEVADGSRRSSKAQAFVMGQGKSRRIILYDTLVQRMTPEAILAVLAHEVGHAKHQHVRRQSLGHWMISGLNLALVFVVLRSPEFAMALGLDTAANGAGLLAFAALLQPSLDLLLNLWPLAQSRRHEWQADAFAAAHGPSPAALHQALSQLADDHLAHPSPHPLHTWLYASHPPLSQRLKALDS